MLWVAASGARARRVRSLGWQAVENGWLWAVVLFLLKFARTRNLQAPDMLWQSRRFFVVVYSKPVGHIRLLVNSRFFVVFISASFGWSLFQLTTGVLDSTLRTGTSQWRNFVPRSHVKSDTKGLKLWRQERQYEIGHVWQTNSSLLRWRSDLCAWITPSLRVLKIKRPDAFIYEVLFLQIIVQINSQSRNALIQLHEICTIRKQSLQQAHQTVCDVCRVTDAFPSSRGASRHVARDVLSEHAFGFLRLHRFDSFFTECSRHGVDEIWKFIQYCIHVIRTTPKQVNTLFAHTEQQMQDSVNQSLMRSDIL